MKSLWIVTISCFLIANAVSLNAMQQATATPTPDIGCGANSATGGCVADQTTSTKKHHYNHATKKSAKKSKKKSTDATPAPAASPSPK